jgi:hypothetical protein
MASRNNLALVGSEATLGEAMARAGRGASRNPSSLAQIANWTNSTAPESATLANTTAGYATLGGLWQAASIGSAATDYCLFAYLVPAGMTLYITGVNVSTTLITGAANATTATLMQWGLGLGASAISLATAGIARVPLGVQSCIAAAAIGVQIGPAIEVAFPTPHVVVAGDYARVILTIPLMTATSSEVLRGTVGVNGYFG